MPKNWSNLAQVVYSRTYARTDSGVKESWEKTVERVIRGNIKDHNISEKEIKKLEKFMLSRKAIPAGRGLWYSGAPSHAALGGIALNNCWGLVADKPRSFVVAMDLLMLGGGVGLSVEHRYVSKLPTIKNGVNITHKGTKDADFIVPDSREGWCELFERVLDSYFRTGKSFSYSTVCVRGYGEAIKGFGGTASGPAPLIRFVENVCEILDRREGKAIRPIDAMDLICATGEMVVAGNVRRSAILILGDPFDKEYLRSKRWDLGSIPTYRAFANLSVCVDDVEDLHPLFWKTYESGEPFGIVNRKNMQTYARMGEKKKDGAVIVNPCVPAGTEILTDTGYQEIQNLVGKTVNVWNGFEWSEVTPKVTGHNQEMVKVTLSDGRSLTCTLAHKFVLSTDYRGGTERKEAQYLEPGEKLIKHKYPVIHGGDTVSWAYSQGFLSGDGTDDYPGFTVYGDKIKCIPRLDVEVGSYSQEQDRTYVSIRFDAKPKSFVPENWSVQSSLDWLAGLIDSDGTRTIEGGCQITSVDHKFLSKVQRLLTKLGVHSKICSSHEAGYKQLPDGKGGMADYYCQESKRLVIGSTQIQDLLDLGMQTERVDFEASPQRDAGRFTTVVSVEPAGVADVVYCFTEPKRNLGCFNGIVTGQCAEATLEPYEPCNLQELALANLDNEGEFVEAAVLMHRYGKRVTMEKYHHPEIEKIIKKNRRVGTGITGCLESPLFNPNTLDKVYEAIQKENLKYSKELGIPESIRTTVVKPSGTVSKLLDQRGEGIHPAYSRYMIQRVRFASNDKLLPALKEAGHYMEPVVRFDGTLDQNTMVVDFYLEAPEGMPCADENFDTWKQLDVLLMAQKHWADQACSVTVYYKREDLPKLKEWLSENLKSLKTISFLCHNDHGFKQAPKEAISKEKFEELSKKIRPIKMEGTDSGSSSDLDLECASGVCPIK
jgi:ribonucleotide reductase alpha subunit